MDDRETITIPAPMRKRKLTPHQRELLLYIGDCGAATLGSIRTQFPAWKHHRRVGEALIRRGLARRAAWNIYALDFDAGLTTYEELRKERGDAVQEDQV